MNHLQHWDFRTSFTIEQAALLIVGLDADDPAYSEELPAKAVLVMESMENSYLLGLHAFRRFLEEPSAFGNHPPDQYLKSLDFLYHESVYVEDGDTRDFMHWLSDRGQRMQEQEFTQGAISHWLTVNELPSSYVFRPRKAGSSVAVRTVDPAPVSSRERNTLLCIIAALCHESKIDFRKPSSAAVVIRDIAHNKLGVAIGETTIEGHLKKIPDTLEHRAK